MRNDPSSHVEDERLVRLACNEVDDGERIAIFAHLDRCDDCARVWQAVEHVQAAAVEFDPGAIPPGPAARSATPAETVPMRRPRTDRRPIWLGLAAAATLVVGLALWPTLTSRDAEPTTPLVVRSADAPTPRPIAPAESARVDRPVFSWAEVDNAVGYSIELLDELGQTLWTSGRLTERSMAWPAAIDQTAGFYYWRVFAHFEDGEEATPSPLISFELIDP